MILVTLNQLDAFGPCEESRRMLLDYLGKTEPDDEPFPLEAVLESNSLYAALWCLRALGPEHREWIRQFADELHLDVENLLLSSQRAQWAAAWAAYKAAAPKEGFSSAAWKVLAWGKARYAVEKQQSSKLREYLRSNT